MPIEKFKFVSPIFVTLQGYGVLSENALCSFHTSINKTTQWNSYILLSNYHPF